MSLLEGMILNTVDPLLLVQTEDLLAAVSESYIGLLEGIPSVIEPSITTVTETINLVRADLVLGQESVLASILDQMDTDRVATAGSLDKILGGLAALPVDWKDAFKPGVDELGSLVTSIGTMGKYGALEEDVEAGSRFSGPVQAFLKRIGLSVEALEVVKASPLDRAAAAKLGTGISIAAQTGLGIMYSIGVLAEAASLGQIETVIEALDNVLTNTGIDEILKPLFGAPFWPGLITPARQHWASVFTPEIPPPADLIRFLVREVITTDIFSEQMAYQGFSKEKSDWFWDAHWRDIAETRIHEAFHRGIITREDRDKFLVLLDFRPTARPGISVPDLNIVAGLAKRLIPRVDLRRGWDLGELTDTDLLQGYVALGYEEDAPKMAEIQKAIALGAERSSYARALLRAYRKGEKTAEEVRKDLAGKRFRPEAVELMLATEDLQLTTGAAEPGEEPRALTAAQILRAYRLGILTDAASKERLLAMRYRKEDIALLLQINEPYLEQEPRFLTPSQILRSYQERILSEEVARGRLEAYGYALGDIAVLLGLYARKELVIKAPRRLTATDIRYGWEGQLPGFEDMAPLFEALDYAPGDAVNKAAIERRRILAPDIADMEREVERRFNAGFITEEQARWDLEALGFHPLRIDAKIEFYRLRRLRLHMEAQLDSAEEAYLRDVVEWPVVADTAKRLIINPEVREEYLDRVYFRKLRVVRVAA